MGEKLLKQRLGGFLGLFIMFVGKMFEISDLHRRL